MSNNTSSDSIRSNDKNNDIDEGNFLLLLSDVVGSTKMKIDNVVKGEEKIKMHNEIVIH